jgi:hypothetical protein
MTVLPADHRADLQKLEKIAGKPASLETEGALTPTPSGSTIVAASRSSKTWRSRCIPSSEPEIAGQKYRGAMRVGSAAIPSTDNLFQLPASRTRGPGALGSNGQVTSAPATTRTTDASPTTSSTYYSGLNCVMLRWGQRFGSSGFRA